MPNRSFVVASLLFAFVAFPAAAWAQPQPPGYPARTGPSLYARNGLTFGLGAGLGAMESEYGPIECINCEDSVAGSFDGRIGVMVNPRLALNFEVWGAAQALNAGADATLVQVLVMGSAQYWLAPRLWIKGGIGSAHLSIAFSNDTSRELANGAAGMAAIGYELVSRPRFAMDIQLKGGAGNYEGFADRISQGALQLGLSWF